MTEKKYIERRKSSGNIFFNFVFNVVSVLIGATISFLLILVLVLGVFAIDHYEDIKQHGLKPMAERLWCGPNRKCFENGCKVETKENS